MSQSKNKTPKGFVEYGVEFHLNPVQYTVQ